MLAREYADGATFRQLAARYGGTDVSIRGAVARGGGRSRSRTGVSHWSDERAADALAMHEAGTPVRAIAKHFRVRTDVVADALRAQGVDLLSKRNKHPSIRTVEQCQAIAHAYEAGSSLRALAKEHGCTTPTIAEALRRVGTEPRRPGVSKTWTDEVIVWAAEQYRAGWSQQSIADELGVHQTAVSTRLRAEGVIPPKDRLRRESHGSWKGGRVKFSGGYVGVYLDEEDLKYATPNSNGYALEHRLVMGRAIGRKLTASETVHHLNGDRADNRLENLQLRQGRHGNGVRYRCNACGSDDVEPAPLGH